AGQRLGEVAAADLQRAPVQADDAVRDLLQPHRDRDGDHQTRHRAGDRVLRVEPAPHHLVRQHAGEHRPDAHVAEENLEEQAQTPRRTGHPPAPDRAHRRGGRDMRRRSRPGGRSQRTDRLLVLVGPEQLLMGGRRHPAALYPAERERQMSFLPAIAQGRTGGYRSTPMAARGNMPGVQRVAESSIDARARRVLAAIVRDYIHSGEPVGSHAIARRADVDVSSATVRAVMADLEEAGFLEKPHTSAGRIPTAHGFRYYVDTLLRLRPPLPEERQQIARRAQEATQVDGLMTNASRVLHSLTRHAGVVASPRPQSERLQSIEFLQLREGRVLAVLVTKS